MLNVVEALEHLRGIRTHCLGRATPEPEPEPKPAPFAPTRELAVPGRVVDIGTRGLARLKCLSKPTEPRPDPKTVWQGSRITDRDGYPEVPYPEDFEYPIPEEEWAQEVHGSGVVENRAHRATMARKAGATMGNNGNGKNGNGNGRTYRVHWISYEAGPKVGPEESREEAWRLVRQLSGALRPKFSATITVDVIENGRIVDVWIPENCAPKIRKAALARKAAGQARTGTQTAVRKAATQPRSVQKVVGKYRKVVRPADPSRAYQYVAHYDNPETHEHIEYAQLAGKSREDIKAEVLATALERWGVQGFKEVQRTFTWRRHSAGA